MPRPVRRLTALALTATALLGLAACAPDEEAPTAPPTTDATSAAVFASDEEALAAAVEAYEAYLAVSASISASGEGFDRLAAVTSREYGETRTQELETFADAGLRLSGSYRLDTTSLISRSRLGASELVLIYACQDVSLTRIVNADGVDVTPVGRDERAPMTVELQLTADGGVVAGSELWSGENFC
ncbi:hypothetical protein GCM10009819_20070 [Agromyces tropicus]|uniref:Lipoprotein n=1 Tax=Agromyces tropicus TaxID=555371 RepID=A0ABP5FWW2_9MICO